MFRCLRVCVWDSYVHPEAIPRGSARLAHTWFIWNWIAVVRSHRGWRNVGRVFNPNSQPFWNRSETVLKPIWNWFETGTQSIRYGAINQVLDLMVDLIETNGPHFFVLFEIWKRENENNGRLRQRWNTSGSSYLAYKQPGQENDCKTIVFLYTNSRAR